MTRALFLVAVTLAAGCGGDDGTAGEEGAETSVSIVSPEDGATVTTPVAVKMEAVELELEPAGAAREGAGHLHLMVDADCVSAGETIPADDAHRHLADGSSELELPLAPGEHTLCAQAGTGVHEALEATHEITITVGGTTAGAGEEVWEGTWDAGFHVIGSCTPAVWPQVGTLRATVAPDGSLSGRADLVNHTGVCGGTDRPQQVPVTPLFTGRVTDDEIRLVIQLPGLGTRTIPMRREDDVAEGTANFALGGGSRWEISARLECTSC